MKRHAFAVLLALVALLALTLTALWISPAGELRHVRWRPPAPQSADYASMLPALPGPAAADSRRFLALLDRPLFSPTRRPPPPAPREEAPVANDLMAGASLTGLFEGRGDGGAIVLIDGKPRRVRLNEVVEGWKLTAVQARSVTFTRGAQKRELPLTRAKLTDGPVPPPAAAAAGNPAQPPRPAAKP